MPYFMNFGKVLDVQGKYGNFATLAPMSTTEGPHNFNSRVRSAGLALVATPLEGSLPTRHYRFSATISILGARPKCP